MTGEDWDAKFKIQSTGQSEVASMRGESGDLSSPSLVYIDATRYAPRERIESVTPASTVDATSTATMAGISSGWNSGYRYQWTKQQIVNLKFAQMLARERGQTNDAFERLWKPIHAVMGGVRFREITPGLEILFDTPSGTVEFDDLSSGEKSVILMFADLAVRDLSKVAILIDEIELHLHPQWQLTILDGLRSMLPDCQFIVTTQSPIVAASVKYAKHLFRLGDL